MSKRLIEAVLILLFLTSCAENTPIIHKDIMASISASEGDLSLDKIDNIVVIPIIGCSSCVEKTLSFMKANIANDNILYIVSAKSKSEYRPYLADTIFNHTNTIFDSKLIFQANDLVNNYPVYYSRTANYFDKKTEINGSTVDKTLTTLYSNINKDNKDE